MAVLMFGGVGSTDLSASARRAKAKSRAQANRIIQRELRMDEPVWVVSRVFMRISLLVDGGGSTIEETPHHACFHPVFSPGVTMFQRRAGTLSDGVRLRLLRVRLAAD